jgi:hypothetical protein
MNSTQVGDFGVGGDVGFRLGARGEGIEVVVAAGEHEGWFDALLEEHHYLKACRSIGDHLRQVVVVRGQPAALLVWGPAGYALKDRDAWIGWCPTMRLERLKLVVQNRRFLVLGRKGAAPNLASQAMGAALRALCRHWHERFGYQPLLAETFTDPEAYEGTCYKASNWQAVGMTAGFSRHRSELYVPNERPKKLWLYELADNARALLCAPQLPESCRAGLLPSPSGALPLRQPQMLSLFEVFRHAPDPRSRRVHYRIGAVLTLVAMALLAGRRDISQLARFATKLTQHQREMLGLPLKPGTRFRQVPGYSVFYEVLTRLDADRFAALLSGWLQERSGELPTSLALDGKMLRDHIGMLSLVDHDHGAPQAFVLYEQKEGTERCEQTAAQTLLESLPSLDNKIVTTDALHCQRTTARIIAEKGGDYCLQVKGNQPAVLAHAQRLEAAADPLFARTPARDTDG